MTDSLKKCCEEAAKLANEYVAQFGYDTGIKSKKDIETHLKLHGVEIDQYFQPSDLCYNRTTKPFGKPDPAFPDAVHIYEYLGRDKYRILGENYPYSGEVKRDRRKQGEIVVGRWENGKLVEWDQAAYMS